TARLRCSIECFRGSDREGNEKGTQRSRLLQRQSVRRSLRRRTPIPIGNQTEDRRPPAGRCTLRPLRETSHRVRNKTARRQTQARHQSSKSPKLRGGFVNLERGNLGLYKFPSRSRWQ